MIEKEIYSAKNDSTIDLGIAVEQTYREREQDEFEKKNGSRGIIDLMRPV